VTEILHLSCLLSGSHSFDVLVSGFGQLWVVEDRNLEPAHMSHSSEPQCPTGRVDNAPRAGVMQEPVRTSQLVLKGLSWPSVIMHTPPPAQARAGEKDSRFISKWGIWKS
jgi:hypothetical protein